MQRVNLAVLIGLISLKPSLVVDAGEMPVAGYCEYCNLDVVK